MDIGASANLQVVDKFCYLGDMLSVNGDGWLVSWSLTSLFSTNMAISEMKGQGWRVILTQ